MSESSWIIEAFPPSIHLCEQLWLMLAGFDTLENMQVSYSKAAQIKQKQKNIEARLVHKKKWGGSVLKLSKKIIFHSRKKAAGQDHWFTIHRQS